MMLTLTQTQRVETHISYSMQVVVNRQDLDDTRQDLLRDIRALSNCGLIYSQDAKLFETYVDMWYDRVDFALREQEKEEENKYDEKQKEEKNDHE